MGARRIESLARLGGFFQLLVREWQRLSGSGRAIRLFLVLTFLSSWRLLFSGGTLGLRDDWAIPPLPEQNIIQVVRNIFQPWLPNYLGYSQPRQVGNYVDIILGLFSQLFHFGGAIYSRFPIIFIFLSGYLMWRLLRSIKRSETASLIGGSFYMLTPFVFNTLISGYAKFSISYAFLPLLFELYLELVSAKKLALRRLLLLGLAMGLVGTQLNFLVLGFGLISGYWLFELILRLISRKNPVNLFLRHILLLLVALSGGLILQSHLLVELLGSLFGFSNSQLTADFRETFNSSWLALKGSNLIEAISLFGGGYSYFERTARALPLWDVARLFLPILAALGFLFRPKDRLNLFALLCGLGSIFLLKGENPPLAGLNRWLFEQVSAMVVIRNLLYVTFIGALAYAILISSFVDGALIRWPARRNLIAAISLVAIILAEWPMLTGNFGGQIRAYRVEEDTTSSFRELLSESGDWRLLELPFHQPMTYFDENGNTSFPGDNPFVAFSPKPALWMGVFGAGFPPFNAFISNLMNHGLTSKFGRALSLANVKKVLFDRHFQSNYPGFVVSEQHPWLGFAMNNRFVSNFLGKQSDLKLSSEKGQVSIYDNQSFLESRRLKLEKTMPLVVGDYLTAHKIEGVSTKGRSPVFASQVSLDENQSALSAIGELWLDSNESESLFEAFLPKRTKIDPANFVGSNDSDAHNGFRATYRNEWWWLEPKIAGLENSILTFAKDRFSLPIEVETAGKYHILVKPFLSERGSRLRFSLADNSPVEISTRSAFETNYRYFDLGQFDLLAGQNSLVFESDGLGLNAIARVIVVSETDLLVARRRAADLLNERNLTLLVDNFSETGSTRQISLSASGDYAVEIMGRKGFRYKLLIDGQPVFGGQLKADGQNPAGKVFLSAGRHKLELVPEVIEVEVLDDPSFEVGLWGGAKDSNIGLPTPPDFSANRSSDRTEGEFSVELESRSHIANIHQTLSDFDEKAVYRISFDYKNVAGNPPAFALKEEGSELIKPYDFLPKSSSWQRYEFIWRPSPGATGGTLHFFAHPTESGGQTINRYDRVSVIKLRSAESLMLHRRTSQLSDPPASTDLTFETHSPTKYRGQIAEPGFLVFNEAFDRRWRLKINGRPIDPENQFRVFGFAQAWPVTSAGEFELEYRPASLFRIVSYLATILTFLGFGLLPDWRGWFRRVVVPVTKRQRKRLFNWPGLLRRMINDRPAVVFAFLAGLFVLLEGSLLKSKESFLMATLSLTAAAITLLIKIFKDGDEES